MIGRMRNSAPLPGWRYIFSRFVVGISLYNYQNSYEHRAYESVDDESPWS